MSKKKPAAAPASASGKSMKTINRKRNNAATRKSLPKALKIQFAGSDRATFRALLEAWRESRKKVSAPL